MRARNPHPPDIPQLTMTEQILREAQENSRDDRAMMRAASQQGLAEPLEAARLRQEGPPPLRPRGFPPP